MVPPHPPQQDQLRHKTRALVNAKNRERERDRDQSSVTISQILGIVKTTKLKNNMGD